MRTTKRWGLTNFVSILSAEDRRLSPKYKVVAFSSESNGDTTSKQDEGEHFAILQTRIRVLFSKIDGDCTFSLQSKKNFRGSLPYAMADPMIGSQWKTVGGVDSLRGAT